MSHFTLKLISLFFGFTLATSLWAAEKIVVTDPNNRLSLSIAADTLTRVVIEGARVRQILHDSDTLTVQVDNSTGQVFLQPQSEKIFNVFLTTEDDRTYHLHLTPTQQDNQSIVIDPIIPPLANILDKKNSLPYESSLVGLIQQLVKQKIPSTFQGQDRHQAYLPPSLLALTITPISSLFNKTLQADVVQLTNITKEVVVLEPALFYQNGVLANYLSRERLLPGQDSQLIIISQRRLG